MTSILPLILSEESVTRETRYQVSKPHVAVVYADAYGHVAHLNRPLSRAEARRTFKTRYVIDLGDHRRTAHLDHSPLPSRGDAYFFQSAVDVGFRVTDPEAVVRRHVTDALAVVYGYLIAAFRPVTRRYDIRQAKEAESAINDVFERPVTLDEGITIYRCVVRLLPDRAAQEYLRSLDSADRFLNVGEAQHKVATATARHHHELSGMAQQARLAAERNEYEAMAAMPLDIEGLIRGHLAKHPDETAYALELLQRHHEAQIAKRDLDDKRSLDLVRYMIEQGMIQSADIELLRTQALGRVQEIASPPRPAELPAAAWDDPLPAGTVLKAAAEAGLPVPVDTSRIVPVYVVIDESPGDQSYFGTLNASMRTLLAELSDQPEIMGALRLSVLGYAADVAVRMPLTAVAADSFVPQLTSRPGARLGSAFGYLRGRIGQDVDRLKAQELTVGRPVVHLLCASTPDDDPAWGVTHRQLTDKAGFPAAPNILACGIGTTPSDVIRTVTALPQSSGWVADPYMPLGEAASRYAEFLRESITALGRAHITGRPDAAPGSPAGFYPAIDLI